MYRNIALLLTAVLFSGCSVKRDEGALSLIEGRGISSSKGMVVSAHRLSSLAGAGILSRGGNAIDAAVATELALAVCYPEAGNIGGGGFMLIRTSDGKNEVFDYREKAPLLASRDMFLDADGNVVEGSSTDSHLASGVPGTVDGILNAHSKYGKLPLRDVIQPAIDMAENGFALSAGQARSLNSNREQFLARNESPTAFVRDSLWKEGDIFIQKDLASTLCRIRDNGRDGFYSGETAKLILEEMSRGRGLISEKDLNEYRSVPRVPLSSDYKGYRIITASPPSGGGLILLQLLKMIEPYPLNEMGFHSVEAIHLMTEAERRAYADRSEYLGDPDFIKIPVEELISAEYLKNRMSSFGTAKASVSLDVKPGNPEGYTSEETTHYSVVDSEGNAVSTTTTLNDTFGSSIVVAGAGFLLNNQMDDFSVKPGVPNMYGLVGGMANSITPGKRMLSSMTPSIVEKGGELFMIAGSPGGSTIPTSVFQVLVNVIDFNMNIQEAVDTGRFHHQWLPDLISLEEHAVDSLTVNKLSKMGHLVKNRSSIGRVNAILVSPDGKRWAAADKRGNNWACGY